MLWFYVKIKYMNNVKKRNEIKKYKMDFAYVLKHQKMDIKELTRWIKTTLRKL